MKRTTWILVGVWAVLATVPSATVYGEVTLHALFSEGAVLQQKMRVPIWGTARDGETITVKFQKQTVSTTASEGRWMVTLAPLRAGGPFTLEVKGDNTLTRTNILVGEVWICSGQSNMQMALAGCAHASETIAQSNDPMLRLLTVPDVTSDTPQRDVNAAWSGCGPATVPGFSAVAYYFGRDLRRARKVPVGLIHTSWGGTIAEAWTTRQEFEAHPDLKPILDSYDRIASGYPEALAKYKQDEPAIKAKYEEAVAKAKAEETKPPTPPAPPADPARNPNHPCALYNAMIAPLQPFAIRGAIWYQGESNAGAARQYRTLFPAMIHSWRQTWGQGDFPFLFVQLAPFGSSVSGNSSWAELREAQWLTAQTTPKTAMAVITDVGDCGNIHPTRKEPVGGRLALAARAIAYGEWIEFSGPIYHAMKVQGDRVVLTFTHVDGGLASDDKGGTNAPLQGFTIAGADHKFVNATAEIHGARVVVSSPAVKQPVAVRYGWADCPSVNLYNKKGLPASPFRTDP